MKLIEQNPFRILGIYANAKPAEIVSNCDDMEAYLSIGQSVSFDLDLNNLMPNVVRSADSVANAKKQINLPKDKLKYALFWFIKDSSVTHAINHLKNSDYNSANIVFELEDTFSTKINKAVVAILQDDLGTAISSITEMIHEDELRNNFVKAICGGIFTITEDELAHLYIDSLLEEINASKLLEFFEKNGTSDDDNEYLRTKVINEPMSRINSEIAKAKAVKRDDADANYMAGEVLLNNTRNDLAMVKNLLGASDMKYQMLADDLAKTVMLCGINYIKNVEGENQEKIENALKLANNALKIAVRKIAHDYIQKNMNTLSARLAFIAISNIRSELKLKKKPTIDDAIKYMHDCASYIITLKECTHLWDNYVRISTSIVIDVLNIVISRFNDECKLLKKSNNDYYSSLLLNPNSKYLPILYKVWKAILMMDKFDKEENFRIERYEKNKLDFKLIIIDCGGPFIFEEDIDALMHKDKKDYSDTIVDDWFMNGKMIGIKFEDRFSSVLSPHFEKEIDPIEFDLRTDKEQYNDCRTIYDFSLYIYRNPNGKYVQEAQSKLEDLIYNKCNTISKCENYLKRYPNGRYSKQVGEKKENLMYRECDSIDKCAKYIECYPKGRYLAEVNGIIENRVNTCSTIIDCNAYLKLYPNGKYSKQIEEKKEDLVYGECDSITKCENYLKQYPNGKYSKQIEEKKEDLVYGECDTITKCENYLKQYPNGRYNKQIEEKKEDLIYGHCNSIAIFEDYLRQYPKGRYCIEARERIKELIDFNECKNFFDYRNYLKRYPNSLKKNEAERIIQDNIEGNGALVCILVSVIIGVIVWITTSFFVWGFLTFWLALVITYIIIKLIIEIIKIK